MKTDPAERKKTAMPQVEPLLRKAFFFGQTAIRISSSTSSKMGKIVNVISTEGKNLIHRWSLKLPHFRFGEDFSRRSATVEMTTVRNNKNTIEEIVC